jgi:SulP family sulfate permease
MVAAGLLKLGRYTRFVSHSVMTGFLTGVAVNILLSQLNYFTGVPSQGGPAIRRALHVITHPGLFDWPTLITGLCAIAILLALRRGPVASYASMVALAVPTIALQLLGTAGVVRVGDVGEIPAGLPLPHIPPLSAFSLNVVAGAFAVAAIVLVQGGGGSASRPPTQTERRPIRIGTSSPRVPATWPPGSIGGSPRVARSAKRPSTAAPGPSVGGRRWRPVCGCWSSWPCSPAW